MRWLLMLGVAWQACVGTGGIRRWDTTGDRGGWAEQVTGLVPCLDAFSERACQRWYRAGTDPVAGPMWFLVASSGSACAVDGATYVMAVVGESFTCRWRAPRD